MRSDPPEPKGKLNTMTGYSWSTPAVATAPVVVNGPEDVVPDWDVIEWRRHEGHVRRLRQRIFKATQEGDLATVRNLQKLMLRSWSNTLVSVRQATQRNAGRKTAGVDGQVALTSHARMELAVEVHRDASSWQPRPVKRVYIPKAGNRAKLRPLGIPVIADRCHQGRVRAALEPEWEARFEPRSYGFRPGRGCHDAIGAIYTTCCGPRAKRVWVLDADLAAAFDKIDHARLLEALGSFPARDMIRAGLAGGDPLRRRHYCALPHPAAGGAGQGIAGGVADAQGSGLQRGQDPDRAPDHRVRFSGVQRPPLRRQTADQTIQGGHPADPGTAPHRDARAARIERGGGHRHAQPDHPGLGCLLPGRGVEEDVQCPGRLSVEAHLQVGHP